MAPLLVAVVATLALGETAIARGMKQVAASTSPRGGRWAALVDPLANPWVLAGGALLAGHLALYATALGRYDLSLVMPITAASYPLGTILASTFLREGVDPTRWLGTAIITAGVAVIAWGEARSGG